jgi:putative ABC transport system ATP-binding protein
MVLGIPFLVGALSQSNVKSVVILNGLLVTLLGLVGVFLFARTSRQSSLGLLETNAVEQRSQSEMNGYSVEVVDVTKSYVVGPVVVPAVNGLTMKVRNGEFVAVMGPSGCGKSTLLNLIGALDRPTSGQVLIDGTNISKLSAQALAQLRNEKVGFVFQAYNLINRSNVLRNVELPMLVGGAAKDHRSTRTREMLNVVGLDSMESRKPKTMSGGEQQRVAIARALVNNPKIVLADEPTGNLDSKAGMEILSFLKSTNKELNTTVIMVTHNREAAEMADRIIYLRDGRVEKEERLRSEFK